MKETSCGSFYWSQQILFRDETIFCDPQVATKSPMWGYFHFVALFSCQKRKYLVRLLENKLDFRISWWRRIRKVIILQVSREISRGAGKLVQTPWLQHQTKYNSTSGVWGGWCVHKPYPPPCEDRKSVSDRLLAQKKHIDNNREKNSRNHK